MVPPEEGMSDNDPIRCMEGEDVMVTWLKDERDHFGLACRLKIIVLGERKLSGTIK